MQESLQKKYIAGVVLLVLLAFGVGTYFGYTHAPAIDKITVANKETEVPTTADFAPFWKVWNTINAKYPGANAITDQERVYGAISGLVGSLKDPYSIFFKPDEAKSFEEDIQGNFTGIGLEVGMKDKILTVIAPLKGTPAYRADLKPGDKILKINDTSTTNLSIDDAIKMIRGDKGTSVTLAVARDGVKQPIEVKIVRDVIEIPTLDTEVKDGVFVIHLYSFTGNSADLFRQALLKFSTSGTNDLILDLRSNPGGYLDAAVDMASWFLPSGKTIVTEDYGANKKPDVLRSHGPEAFNDNLKFAILIDSGSASASEIFAGAMQDYKKAILVGQQSFGKGSVQEVVNVTPDTILKVTVAKWLTPNGTSISEKGLTPDYVVGSAPEGNTKDPVMDKAIELLKK